MDMSSLFIGLREDRFMVAPGEELAGRVSWSLDEPAEKLELRLFWYTEGKGDQDVEIVDSVSFASPGLEGREEFRFVAPAGPVSFSGKLISLIWALELVALPEGETARQEIVISPTGLEIRIDRRESDASAG